MAIKYEHKVELPSLSPFSILRNFPLIRALRQIKLVFTFEVNGRQKMLIIFALKLFAWKLLLRTSIVHTTRGPPNANGLFEYFFYFF